MGETITAPTTDRVPLVLDNLVTPARAGTALMVIPEDLSDDPKAAADIEAAKRTVNFDVAQTRIQFGTRAGTAMAATAAKMIEGARNRDIQPVGDMLGNVVLLMKGFNLTDLNRRAAESKDPGWLARKLMGAMTTLQMAMQRYNKVESQIDGIVAKFDRDVGVMMRDLAGLEKMYGDAAAAYRMLAVDVAAGNQVADEQKRVDLAALQAKAEAGGQLAAQQVADLTDRIQAFEQRVYELTQMKAATLLTMPQIRTMEQGEIMLISRVQTMLQLAIPLWKQQVAMLLVGRRMAGIAASTRAAGDFTNDMLVATAAQTKATNKIVREESARGLFDEDALKQATSTVVAMFEETQTIFTEVQERHRSGMAAMAESEEAMRKVMAGMSLAVPGEL